MRAAASRPEGSDESAARLNTNAERERLESRRRGLLEERRSLALELECSGECPRRVIFACGRRVPDCENSISDEFLHEATVRLDDARCGTEKCVEQRSGLF